MLGWGMQPEGWAAPRAIRVFAEAEKYGATGLPGWTRAADGSRAPAVQRSLLTVQVLSHANHIVRSPLSPASLPERIGGDKNYDYRYAWVRDASLALALLARLGKAEEVQDYLGWLCGLHSTTEGAVASLLSPKRYPYLEQEDVEGVPGYKNSQPVRRGNRAAKQMQLGSMGFFADCARIYLDQGGEWRNEFWQL